MKTIWLLSVLCLVGTAFASKQWPEKFLGKWEVEKSENFDEYLEAKGYGWFMRQMVKLASITKIFEKSTEVPGTYNVKILTSKKNVEWKNVPFGQEFQGEYLDDSQHKITIDYDAAKDELTERHTNIDKPEEKPDLYTYTRESSTHGEYIIMRMEANGVATKRWYKKTD